MHDRVRKVGIHTDESIAHLPFRSREHWITCEHRSQMHSPCQDADRTFTQLAHPPDQDALNLPKRHAVRLLNVFRTRPGYGLWLEFTPVNTHQHRMQFWGSMSTEDVTVLSGLVMKRGAYHATVWHAEETEYIDAIDGSADATVCLSLFADSAQVPTTFLAGKGVLSYQWSVTTSANPFTQLRASLQHVSLRLMTSTRSYDCAPGS